MAWIKTDAAKQAFQEIVREHASAVSGNNTLISRTEQKNLGDFLFRVAEKIRADQGKGARVSVDELVDTATTEAMKVWEKFNPPGPGVDSRYLSRAEIREIKSFDSPLGLLTAEARERAAVGNIVEPTPDPVSPRFVEVTMTTNHPTARLERDGETYKLVSDREGAEATLGFRPTATLEFEGHSVTLEAGRSGLFSTWRLQEKMPGGYWATHLESNSGVPKIDTFKVEKAHPDAIGQGQALTIARDALAEYVRTERMHDGDWTTDLALPSTWDGLVAEGIMDWINAFGDQAPEPGYGAGEVIDLGAKWTVVGPGPFGLHSEVSIDKVDRSVTFIYVEID